MGRAAWDLDLIAFSSHLLCNVDGDHEEDESHVDKIQSNLAKPPYPPPTNQIVNHSGFHAEPLSLPPESILPRPGRCGQPL